MELWDAYDGDFRKIPNMTLIRGETIPEGVYHLVSEIIVRHTDGTYLLMQRDRRKPYGGLWEATAGGSALQHESPLECAIRELLEETGIQADHMLEVGEVRSDHTIYVEFLCVTGCEKDHVTLQEGETIAYRWVSRSELISMEKNVLLTERIQAFIQDLQK
ncbi:MAG: NUDIX hydrolase [Clostridia bacterium]|nr:NUDIX hydrolase [Clostridia bacterium]